MSGLALSIQTRFHLANTFFPREINTKVKGRRVLSCAFGSMVICCLHPTALFVISGVWFLRCALLGRCAQKTFKKTQNEPTSGFKSVWSIHEVPHTASHCCRTDQSLDQMKHDLTRNVRWSVDIDFRIDRLSYPSDNSTQESDIFSVEISSTCDERFGHQSTDRCTAGDLEFTNLVIAWCTQQQLCSKRCLCDLVLACDLCARTLFSIVRFVFVDTSCAKTTLGWLQNVFLQLS